MSTTSSARRTARHRSVPKNGLDFILADGERRRAVAEWAEQAGIDEASMMPPQRLPQDALNRPVRGFLETAMGHSVLKPPFRSRH